MSLYEQSYADRVNAEAREREGAFDALTAHSLGDSAPAFGMNMALRLDAALNRMMDEKLAREHATVKYHDRVEDLAADLAKSDEVAS